MPIRQGRAAIEKEIQTGGQTELAEFGIELLDLRFKRINYNPSVVERIFERMISDGSRSRPSSAPKAKARRLASWATRSETQRDRVGGLQAGADDSRDGRCRATRKSTPGLQRDTGGGELYEFVKTMDTFKKVINRAHATLVLSTDSVPVPVPQERRGPPPARWPRSATPR